MLGVSMRDGASPFGVTRGIGDACTPAGPDMVPGSAAVGGGGGGG